MSTITTASNISAPAQFLQVKNDAYAYRRFGSGPGCPCCASSISWAPSRTGIRR
jgi:hypothetical protein